MSGQGTKSIGTKSIGASRPITLWNKDRRYLNLNVIGVINLWRTWENTASSRKHIIERTKRIRGKTKSSVVFTVMNKKKGKFRSVSKTERDMLANLEPARLCSIPLSNNHHRKVWQEMHQLTSEYLPVRFRWLASLIWLRWDFELHADCQPCVIS